MTDHRASYYEIENRSRSAADVDLHRAVSSQQVSWWEVHTYIKMHLDRVGSWPMVGTPAWCELPDDDAAKLAAVFDAAQLHALRMETAQEAMCDASKAITEAEDWSTTARRIRNRTEFHNARPWMKRRSA